MAEADAWFERAIDKWRELGDDAEVASTLDALAWALFFQGIDDRGLAAFEQSLEIRRRSGDERGETRALVGVCQFLVAQGNIERAESLSSDLLALSQRDGDMRSEHFAVHFLADCALMRHDYDAAARRYRESLRAAVALGDTVETSIEVQGVAMALAGQAI